MNIAQVSINYSVSPQLDPSAIEAIKDLGFVAIICNRPDGEEPGQATAAEIAAACEQYGLSFHHIPVSGMPIPADTIEKHRQIVDTSGGAVLAYCRSGQRSIIIWQASA